MFDWNVVEEYSVGGIEPDDTWPVDFVYDEPLVKKIYQAWDEDVHGSLLDFGGGVRAITVSMLLDAGYGFLESIRGIGNKRATEILEQATNARREVMVY